MMTIREQISEYNPEAILFDDLDDAVIGVGQQHGSQTVAVYDRDKCIEIFYHNFSEEKKEQVKRELTDDELLEAEIDAIEWFDYNVGCAYVGENTPIFVERFEDAC
jgi:hypothetical protein